MLWEGKKYEYQDTAMSYIIQDLAIELKRKTGQSLSTYPLGSSALPVRTSTLRSQFPVPLI